MSFKGFVFIALLGSMAGAECAWAGGDFLPAKVLSYQKGFFTDVVDLQIGKWGGKDLEIATARFLRLEMRYDYLRMFWWYGFSSRFTRADFALCADRLARYAKDQTVFELGFLGSSWPDEGNSMNVRAFDLYRPDKEQGEGVCYIVPNRI